jgi:hypothetical protein
VRAAAAQHTSTDHILYSLRSECIGRQGRAEDALPDALHATTLAPLWGDGFAKLGTALESVGRTEARHSRSPALQPA